MTRCLTCNGIIRKTEKVCFTCGEGIPGYRPQMPFAKRFAWFITTLFFASLALTGASLFVAERTPPFTACVAASIILLFVKRSADQIASRQS